MSAKLRQGETEPSLDREEITRPTAFETQDGVEKTRPADDGREIAPSAASGIEIGRGTVIGRYTILECLGEGGMATVYSAHDTQLDRIVALKLLRPHEDVAEVRARLFREAQAMARLSHPNVVTVYDVGVASDGRVFLSMEIASGGTLAAWLKERKRSWREIVTMLCEAGEGLAAAHRVGIVHRDFKLENVLIGAEHRPQVTDFGVASVVTAGPGRAAAPRDHRALDVPVSAIDVTIANPSKTEAGTPGTPGYMAPEQYQGLDDIDARADVFAFCATLYRALYGERPFEGSSVVEIAAATFSGQVRAAPKGSDVPPWLRRVILRGLAVKREARPQSMPALLAALRVDPVKRRRRWLAVGTTVLVGCAVAWRVHAAEERRGQQCRAMADRFHGVWDRARKQSIESAFRATQLAYANDTWTKVERALDAYTRNWGSAMEQACVATRVRGERSAAMLQLQTACMDTRFDELRALSDVLAGADPKTVETAVRASQALSPIDACTDLDRVSISAQLPADPTARAEIRALQAEIAQAKALQLAGKPRESLERLEAMRDRISRGAFGPLAVSWRMRKASDEAQLDAPGAAADFEQAAALADTHRLDTEKSEALLGLVRHETRAGHYDQSHRWLTFAGASIARVGGDVRLEALRDIAEGWLHVQEGRAGLAIPLLEQAVGIAQQRHLDDADILYAYSGLATALVAQGRFDEGFKTYRVAIALAEAELGPLHPWIVTFFYNNLASDQLDAGRVEDALATASRAVAYFEAAAGRGEILAGARNLAIARSTLGQVLIRAGRAREAIEQLELARTAFKDAGDELAALTDKELDEARRRLGPKAAAKR